MPFRGYERISFVHFVTQRRPGQPLAITVQRAGENLALSLDLVAAPKLVPRLDGVDARPQYLIVGGLVFVPLSVPFLMHHFGWPKYSPPPELLKWLREPQTEGSDQVVVLAKVLAADLNFGYQARDRSLCCSVALSLALSLAATNYGFGLGHRLNWPAVSRQDVRGVITLLAITLVTRY